MWSGYKDNYCGHLRGKPTNWPPNRRVRTIRTTGTSIYIHIIHTFVQFSYKPTMYNLLYMNV